MKLETIKIESDKADPYAKLRLCLEAAIGECDGGLLRAESSQAQFNATRVHLHGRREVLIAVLHYLDGKPDALETLTRP